MPNASRTHDQLRVAMLAPISWRVPPRHYGPWEQFVSLLTEGLVARGVDVTLFATADSVTAARLVGTAPTGYSEDPSLDAKVWEGLHIATVFERASEFDLIHNNFDFLPLTYSGLVDTPVVTTVHGFSSERIVPVFERYDGRAHYVSISDADRHPNLTYDATIHHGIDMAGFPLGESPEERPAVLRPHPSRQGRRGSDRGRGTRRHAAHDRRASCRTPPTSTSAVRPRIDGERVTYVGAVGPAERGALLAERDRDAASHQLRGTVRVQRRRVDGLRHAGRRPPPRLDARDRASTV